MRFNPRHTVSAFRAHMLPLLVSTAVAAACARGPNEARDDCPIDSGDFAFPSAAGGPILKPGDRRNTDDSDGDAAPGADHDHGHGHAHHDENWHPGADAIGTWKFRAQTNQPDARQPGLIEEAWLPARTLTVPEWTASTAATANTLSPDVALAAIRAANGPVFLARATSDTLPAIATATEITALANALANLPAHCVDDLCRFGNPRTPLTIAFFAGPRNTPRLAGLLTDWDGNPLTFNRLSKAIDDHEKAPVTAEIGEILSLEEGGRLDEVRRRLEVLAATVPENHFIAYFLARNTAARGRDAAAVAALEQLATDPRPAVLGVLALAAQDPDWLPLRTHPRVLQALKELLTRIPGSPATFARWLLRFRASVPHLRIALAPNGPTWFELQQVLASASIFEPVASPENAETIVFQTPAGPITLHLIRDASNLPAITAIDTPTAWR